MKRFMTEVYSRTVDKFTPLRVRGLRINRWEIELTVDAIKHDKKNYLLKLSPNQNGVKYLFLLFLSLGEVAINLRKPPWWRFLHIYVLYVTKHNVPIAGETILCLAIILQFAIRQSHKGEQSKKLLLKLVLSSILKANDIYFLIPPASNLLEIDRPRGKGVGGGRYIRFTVLTCSVIFFSFFVGMEIRRWDQFHQRSTLEFEKQLIKLQ